MKIFQNFLSIVSSRKVWMIAIVGMLLAGTAGATIWTTNGSDGWQNTISDSTTKNLGTNYIEAANFSDNFDDMNYDYTEWGTAMSISAQNQNLNLSTSGGNYYARGLYYSGNNISNFSINFDSVLYSSKYIMVFFRGADFGISTTDEYIWFLNRTNSTYTVSQFRLILNGDSTPVILGTDTVISQSLAAFSNNHYTLIINGTNFSVYINNILEQSVYDSTLTSGKIGFTTHYTSSTKNNYSVDNLIIKNIINNSIVISGNHTAWYDFGSGRQGSRAIVNFMNVDSNLTADLHGSTDNFTSSDIVIAASIANATWYNINASAKNQTQYIRVVLNGNLTTTPKMMEISIEDEASINQILDNDIKTFWVRTDGNNSCNGQNNMSYGSGDN